MKIHALLAIAAVTGLAAPAHADDAGGSTWFLEAGTQARWLGATSAATVTPGVMFGPKVSVARSLAALPGPRGDLALAAFVRLSGGSNTGQVFQSLDTRIDQLAFSGGGRLDVPLWRGLGAVAQLDLGTARTAVVVGDQWGDQAPVDDSGWGFIGTASIGATFERVFRHRYTVGLAVDVGYTVTSPVALRAEPGTRPEEDLSIPTMYEALGELDTGGIGGSVTLRAGF
jgi:hypothetical protein